MRNALLIDSKDAFLAYGISLAEGAYNDLACLPPLKPIAYNDWHEKNGIEPDLSAPKIAEHTITIPLHLVGGYSNYAAFLAALSGNAYHIFNFMSIGVTRELRLVRCNEPRSIQDLSTFSLTFCDDEPMKDYSYSAPTSTQEPLGDFLLDQIDVANYGLRILRGSMDSIKAFPDVKENLKRDISINNGVLYDGANVIYKSRTAEIRCLMRAANTAEFWNNRNALLYNLTKPGERTLTVAEINKDIPCFYKGCSVQHFYPDNGKVWFEFTLSLEFFKGLV